jgi:hypothetical protein
MGVFTTLTLSNGDKITMDEIKGFHILKASIDLGPQDMLNPLMLSFKTAQVASLVNGKNMPDDYMDNLSMADVSIVLEMVNAQTVKIKKC